MTDGAGEDVTDRDVVVVGGGPAGMAAALGLARARRTVLVVDDGRAGSARPWPVGGYPTRDGIAPAELLSAARREVAGYGGAIAWGTVVAARRVGAGFELDLADPREAHRASSSGRAAELVTAALRARRVVVATGHTDELPEVTGLSARWGRDVLHLPEQLGPQVGDRRIGVLATGPRWVESVHRVRQCSDEVVVLTHTAASPDDEEREALEARDITVVTGEVSAVEVDDDRLRVVRLADGSVVPMDVLALAPRSVARAIVAAALGVDPVWHTVDGVVVGTRVPADAEGRTAVPGAWVAGTVASPGASVVAAVAAGAAVASRVDDELVAEDVAIAVSAHRWVRGDLP